jgi:hypothetical protein
MSYSISEEKQFGGDILSRNNLPEALLSEYDLLRNNIPLTILIRTKNV